MNNIFTYTGNPFVDAGITAMLVWLDKENPEEIEDYEVKNLFNELTDLYVQKSWNKMMYSVFPNSKLTNPSVKDKKGEYDKLLNELLSEVVTLDSHGNCIACGKRDSKRYFTKTQVPLTGTSDFINFFSYGNGGADYCSACALAIQFSPLVFYKCGNLVCLQSNNKEVEKIYAKKCKSFIDVQKATKEYTGCNDEGYTNPVNALFHLVTDIILTYDRREWHRENTGVRLYHFTNFNQPPLDNLSIYDMPDEIFKFLAYALQHEERDNWKKVIKRGYFTTKKANLDDEEEYKNLRNDVYERLLRGQSILRYFVDTNQRRTLVKWSFLEYYMKEVRKMEAKRLDTIKKVADDIAQVIKTKGNIKRLAQLETAKNYGEFRNVLRLIIKDRINAGFEKPLFSIDEYEKYLFPEGNLSWKETQDLIVFRLYEQLHDWLVNNDKEIKEDLVEDEEEDIELI
jgi:CRISPR-associated protein Cst1